MKIDKKLLDEWQHIKSHGDAGEIIKLYQEKNPNAEKRIYPYNITNAFQKGECRDHVFFAIRDFYTLKLAKIKKQKPIDYRTDRLRALLPENNGAVILGIKTWIDQGLNYEIIRDQLRGLARGHENDFKKIIGQDAYNFVFSNNNE